MVYRILHAESGELGERLPVTRPDDSRVVGERRPQRFGERPRFPRFGRSPYDHEGVRRSRPDKQAADLLIGLSPRHVGGGALNAIPGRGSSQHVIG